MRNSQRVVYFNGQFVPESEARVSIYDSALNLGDMAFEVTRTYHHRPFRLRDHLKRLWTSLDKMRIDPQISIDELEAVSLETVERNVKTESSDIDWMIVHNVSRGPSSSFFASFTPDELRPTVIVSCYPLVARVGPVAKAYDTGFDLVVPEQRAMPHELLDATIKNRSRWPYQLANMQAADRCPGAWPVLVDPDGFLTESTSANVFIVRGGRLETPEPRNLLLGITRNCVLELAKKLGIPHAETNITVADALAADEMFLTSTTIGVIHARTFEGKLVNGGKIGPISAKLRQALEAEVGLDFAAQAKKYAVMLSAGAATANR